MSKSDSIKAGAAFMAAMESDPKNKAAWERTRAKMQAFGKAIREAMNNPEYLAAQEAERHKWQDLADAIRANVEAAGDELAAQHFTRPESIENWIHLARIVEIPDETIRTGNLTAREIHACALAWADRQTIKAKLSALPEQSELEIIRSFINALDAYAANDSAHRQFPDRYCPHQPGMAGELRGILPDAFNAQNRQFHAQAEPLWRAVAERIPEMMKLAVRYGLGGGVFGVLAPHKPADIAHVRAAAMHLADALLGAPAHSQAVTGMTLGSANAPTSTKPSAPDAKPNADEPADAGGPMEDPHDSRKVVWAGKRIYLGNDTEVSRLFWLLAKPVGRARSLAEVQRAIDGMETDRDSRPDYVRKAGQRMRKVVSKLRAALRDAGLEDHVLIVRGGTQAEPEYSMVWRWQNK